MRENRTCGSEGGEAQSLPYPYPYYSPKHSYALINCETMSAMGELITQSPLPCSSSST